MDKLMAELLAGQSLSPKVGAKNFQKPGTDKVMAVQNSADQGQK